jgi:hypothetical protein
MSNRQPLSVSLLALALIFATAGMRSAAADNDSYAQSKTQIWSGHPPARLHVPQSRYVRDVKSGAMPTRTNKAPDDLCDLPSTGCESFLAN